MSTVSPAQKSSRQARVDTPRGSQSRTWLLRLLACGSVEEAARAFLDDLAADGSGSHCAIGIAKEGGTCRLVALSGVRQLDRKSERVRDLESALDESALRESTFVYRRGEQCHPPSLTTTRLARQLGCYWLFGAPLRDADPEGD